MILTLVLLVVPAGASPISGPSDISRIYLRRAVFDPIERLPSVAAAGDGTASSLRLVQLSAPPDAETPARLQSLGLEPLAYIPDDAYIVRVSGDKRRAIDADWIRWQGPFVAAYKLPAEMDALLGGSRETALDLRIQPTPDADPAALAQVITAGGGIVVSGAEDGQGALLHARLQPAALRALLPREDVMWVETYNMPVLHNDQAREIIGVDTARRQLPWLTGAGQIVAVTDTGLDDQAEVEAGRNPDFQQARIAKGYTNREMSGGCSGDTWSDLNGHGTHVAGTILGSGDQSPGNAFAGMAPGASLVVQAVSSGGNALDCLEYDTFLPKAYAAGARVQNASWGTNTGSGLCAFGCYSSLERSVDTFLWEHPDHLLVVSAGNAGKDTDQNGVIDGDSIGSPATAKNVLTVGSTENNRPALTQRWGDSSWSFPPVSYLAEPIRSDRISDNPNGLAAFSSRGPTDDGRIKPEIVAPGVKIISARSHTPVAQNRTENMAYNRDYMYDSGTSMSAPMISGMAALVRQWLAQEHGIITPSAALVKALLLNGATNLSPGQYGAGEGREIPEAWPNSAEGWGRANLMATIGLGDGNFMFHDNRAGLQTGEVTSYTLTLSPRQSIRASLTWTDYPAAANASKTLVNDLDLSVIAPDGALVAIGNARASIPAACRDTTSGADRCNNVESVEFVAQKAGTYIIRIRAAGVARGPQAFALATGSVRATAAPASAPTQLQASVQPNSPTITLTWNTVEGAIEYEVRQREIASLSSSSPSAVYVAAEPLLSLVSDVGTYEFVVRGCNTSGCGPDSAPVQASITTPPLKLFWPWIDR